LVVGVTMAESSAPKSQWDGAYSKAQALRGEPLYSEHCVMCHGTDLMGGEMAPPLIGGTFHSNWNELTLGDLFERIRTSMPLNAPGTLSRQQCADILSYMLSKDGFPAGQSELPTQTEVLRETKFLGAKP
jgi:quinoprotein glucose dehydrogenase